MSQQIRKLGQTYKEISTWSWLTIFLFWLIFPPIVLLIKKFQLATDMKAAGAANNDQELSEFGDRILIIQILYLLSGITGVTGIVAIILEIMLLSELDTWAINRKIPLAAAGYAQIKTWLIISLALCWLIIPVFIGMMMEADGYSKIGDALLV